MTAVKNPRSSADKSSRHDVSEPQEAVADKEKRQMPTAISQRGPQAGENASLDANLQTVIGHKLKAMFDEVATAPIPDKFLDLLSKLDSREKSK
jgi:hypothetical protein